MILGVERINEEKIKVVYSDGEPIVYRDGNRLNEKEIVDLLVEYFEDCDALIKENGELKSEIQTQKQIIAKQEMKLAEYNNQK